MSATTTRTSNPTQEAGVPPAPPQRTYVESDIRVVTVDCSQIELQYHEGRWLSVMVTTL